MSPEALCSLSKTPFPPAIAMVQHMKRPDNTGKMVDWDVKRQLKQTKVISFSRNGVLSTGRPCEKSITRNQAK